MTLSNPSCVRMEMIFTIVCTLINNPFGSLLIRHWSRTVGSMTLDQSLHIILESQSEPCRILSTGPQGFSSFARFQAEILNLQARWGKSPDGYELDRNKEVSDAILVPKLDHFAWYFPTRTHLTNMGIPTSSCLFCG